MITVAAGWAAAVWSTAICRSSLSCHASGSTRSGCFSSLRNVKPRPFAPFSARPTVWSPPTWRTGVRPPASVFKSSTGTSTGVVQALR